MLVAAPVIDAVLTGAFDEQEEYRVIRPSGTRDHLLTFTQSGIGRYRVGNALVLAQPGDLTLLPPGVPHDYSAAGQGWRFIWAHFHPRPHWAQWLKWPEQSGGIRHLSLTGAPAREVEDLLLAMHRSASGQGSVGLAPLRNDMARALLEQALVICAAQLGGKAQVDERIAAAAARMAGNPELPLDLLALAKSARLSVSRFAHLFSAQLGETPLQFLERLRIDLARRLLSGTSLSIKEVSAQCGFSSQFYFSMRFKRSTGKSPTEWRGA